MTSRPIFGRNKVQNLNIPTTNNIYGPFARKNNMDCRLLNYNSHKIQNKTISKIGNINLNNENDKNINNTNLNNKDISKNLGNRFKASELEDNENVIMKNYKDDSAIKDNNCEKNFRTIVLDESANNNITRTATLLQKTIKLVNINLCESNLNENYSLNLENNLINKEFNPKFDNDEYRRMYTKLLRNEYSNQILDNLFEEEEIIVDCLNNHKVTERMRTRMIDWMIEVFTNYKCDDNSFFIAVSTMDKYFKLCENSIQPSELHLIGVASMFIASKFQDIYPLRLKVVFEKIAHKKLQMQEIKSKEAEIASKLGYILGKPTHWDFINFYIQEIFYNGLTGRVTDPTLVNNYIKPKAKSNSERNDSNSEMETNEEQQLLFNYSDNMLNLLKHVVLYLSKMNFHDYSLIGKKPSLLAASTVFVAMKICEQINKEEYVSDYFIERLTLISRKSENDVIKCAQKILNNAQNFDTLFNGLENLKKVHFNSIIDLKVTK